MRKSPSRWTQLAILIAVFTSGGVTGAMVSARVLHTRLETYRQAPPAFSQDIVERLRMRLNLSEQQVVRVREIVSRRHTTMIKRRNEGVQKMHSEFDAMTQEIGAVLTGSQAPRWRVIADRVRNTYLPVRSD